ncbi:MAG: hypothetical protein U1E61_08875 [Bradyrhizobium sp.]
MAKRPIAVIHGANSDLKWIEQAKAILEHHFEFTPIEYEDYNGTSGLIKALVDIPLCIAGLLGLLLSIVTWLFELGLPAAGVICSILVLYVSIIRGRAARDNVASELRPQLQPLIFPHVLAHSLGSFMFGRLLTKYPSAYFENVVLVCGVLPDDFDWPGVLSDKPGCLSSLRNEYGSDDLVTRFVGGLQPILLDLGRSGVSGFKTCEHVHDNPSATTECSICAVERAKIHNIKLPLIDHSGVLNEDQARDIWLPFFWGYSWSELARYFRLCALACELKTAGLRVEYGRTVADLWSQRFAWTNGLTLDQHVRLYFVEVSLAGRLPEQRTVDDLLRVVRRVLHIVSYVALVESRKTDPDSKVVYRLHPGIAISFAAQFALARA